MPTQEFTQVRTSTHTLKDGATLDGFPGGESYIFTLLSGKAYVQHSDGDLREITEDGTAVPSSKHGDHKITATQHSAVHVLRQIPDHPNSGVSRKPFPDQAEHPLERQDDPEPPGPPAVLKTRSPGGDPDVVAPAENKKQPQTTVARLKASGGEGPTLEDLPEIHEVPQETKDALKAAQEPSKAPSVQKKTTGRSNRKGPKTSQRKSREVKRAAKPSATTGTGSKSPSASAGATKRQTGETGRGTTTKRLAGEPEPNVRKPKGRSPERKR